MEANERWKPIEGHEDYLISDFGNAMNGRLNRELRPCLTSSGYKYIRCGDKNICIHRAVADAFIPKPEINGEKRLIIHHKDGDRGNNHYTNLEWLTDVKHLQIHDVSERVRKARQEKIAGEDENGKVRVWQSKEEAQAHFGLSKDEFILSYLWEKRVTDKDGMTWQLYRVLEIQNGKGETKWKCPRTEKHTKNERRVLDNYIKKSLGK